uniref:C-type lectin domain-containing protein n=1 Tax=Ditylenchus dipsaci TaxID=166011 RepID=A0A915CRM6_9BILA
MEKNIRLMAVMQLMQQNWQLYKQHWYRLFELELMWIPAENFCRQLGGHLVSIRDAAENDFVHALRKSKLVFEKAINQKRKNCDMRNPGMREINNFIGKRDIFMCYIHTHANLCAPFFRAVH